MQWTSVSITIKLRYHNHFISRDLAVYDLCLSLWLSFTQKKSVTVRSVDWFWRSPCIFDLSMCSCVFQKLPVKIDGLSMKSSVCDAKNRWSVFVHTHCQKQVRCTRQSLLTRCCLSPVGYYIKNYCLASYCTTPAAATAVQKDGLPRPVSLVYKIMLTWHPSTLYRLRLSSSSHSNSAYAWSYLTNSYVYHRSFSRTIRN